MKISTDYFKKKMNYPFDEWFKEVTHDDIKIDGSQIDQANSNLWSFSLTDEEKKKIHLNDTVLFIKAIITVLRNNTIKIREHKKLLFYTWYDEMANSIRLSIICGRIEDPLPFTSAIKIIDSIECICSSFLEGKDNIPYDEFETCDEDEEWIDPDEEERDKTELEVYAEEL